jgi:hypothetical protein
MKAIVKTQDNLNWHLSTWLILSVILLNYLDFQTTFYLMEYKNVEEANPFLNYFIMKHDTPWAILWFKIASISTLLVPYLLSTKWRDACQTTKMIWLLGLVNIYYLSIVIFNFNLIAL